MIRKHPILVGCAAGVLVWAVAAWVLFTSGQYNSLFYRTLRVLSWIPDRASRWVTDVVLGGPVEAGAFVFLPISFAYWLCIGAALGVAALFIQRGYRVMR